MNEIRTLNIDEACQLLHTHKSTLYQKIASGEIPAARIGLPFCSLGGGVSLALD